MAYKAVSYTHLTLPTIVIRRKTQKSGRHNGLKQQQKERRKSGERGDLKQKEKR